MDGCYFAEKSILTAVILKILTGLSKLLVCMLSKFRMKFGAKSFHPAIKIVHTVVISLLIMRTLLCGGRRDMGVTLTKSLTLYFPTKLWSLADRLLQDKNITLI